MTSSLLSNRPTSFWAGWSVIAAFGTYFCMYGFRKPFNAAEFAGADVFGLPFKNVVVATQVIGYMLSKFIGIKVVSELPPNRRAGAILGLIAAAELALLLFGLTPRPWNVPWLFLNGLALGMVFGLVLGFLEGRQVTELLVAGLCASFILAGGVTKSVGTELLERNISEDWMPFTAGLVFLLPLCGFVWMLTQIPPPSQRDVALRSERVTMSQAVRWSLYRRHAFGLTAIVVVYILLTILRSIRDDFAPELWKGLGAPAAAKTFTQSETLVAAVVLLISGAVVLIRRNRPAFLVSIGTCICGFVLILGVLIFQSRWQISPFTFMVLTGMGLYLPYVAVHTSLFERILAMTGERGNLAFLMYVADSFGYLAYVAILLSKDLFPAPEDHLAIFKLLGWGIAVPSVILLVFVAGYFATRQAPDSAKTVGVPATEAS